MSKIYTINSEVEIKNDLLRNFRYNREFEQKVLYLGDGAKIFYFHNQMDKPHVKTSFDWEKNFSFLTKNFIKKNQNTAIISLGCGNSCREKEMLDRLFEEKYKFSYYGVDSSMNMIELAENNLEKCKFKKNFIFADIGLRIVHKELKEILKKYDKRIFVLFGNTLGNVPQSFMADSLRNILSKGDILWLDVSIRPDLSDISTGEIFERYLSYLNDDNFKEFLLSPLNEMGISNSDGELILNMESEKSLNNLLFKFNFLLNKSLEVNFEEEISTLIKDESIELHNIRVYDPISLINFFESRHFKFKSKLILKNKAQITFQKI